jgi:formylglycine-generating enzyme required for sulfatase activity
MHGNAFEWCQDWWHDGGYTGAPTDGSAWETPVARHRVARGGSWDVDPRDCRSASRCGGSPADRYNNLGVRLLRSAEPVAGVGKSWALYP